METLAGVDIDVGGEPLPPAGWEVIVSSAHTGRSAGTPRAEFLAELVLVAAVDRRRGRPMEDDHRRDDRLRVAERAAIRPGSSEAWCPSWEATPGPARVARGRGRRVRSVAVRAPPADRRGDERGARPPRHVPLRSGAAAGAGTPGWPTCRQVVRAWELDPVAVEPGVSGAHNRNAAAALAALELAGVERDPAAAALGRFTGVGRRFELVGERAVWRSTTTTATTRPSCA